MGPSKCYVMQCAVGVSAFPKKKRYKGVQFNVISVTRGWVLVKFPGKKRYLNLEWSLTMSNLLMDVFAHLYLVGCESRNPLFVNYVYTALV